MGRTMKPLEQLFPNDNATAEWLKPQKNGYTSKSELIRSALREILEEN